MSLRTTETTITFENPFTLTSVEGSQSAGTYRLVTDEEEMLGLSFLVFRRVATMLHVPAISIESGINQVFLVDPAELASALEADARAGSLIPKQD